SAPAPTRSSPSRSWGATSSPPFAPSSRPSRAGALRGSLRPRPEPEGANQDVQRSECRCPPFSGKLPKLELISRRCPVRHPLMIRAFRKRFASFGLHAMVAAVCAWLVCGPQALLALQEAQPAAQAEAPEQAPKLTADQLDALVAPIALYPDDLLAQCLVASTYPIDVMQAQQWADKHKDLKGEALSKEAMKQQWDPSVQALTGIPDALKMLAQDIKWTTDLGDAFLAQQSEVMDSVQRMRGKAKGGGKLETTEQM